MSTESVGQRKCRREDLNPHALAGTSPSSGASVYSATPTSFDGNSSASGDRSVWASVHFRAAHSPAQGLTASSPAPCRPSSSCHPSLSEPRRTDPNFPQASAGPSREAARNPRARREGQLPDRPGSDGAAFLVDSGARTAHSCAYQSRLVLRGCGLTPPTVRLQTRTVGSVKSGSETMSSHSSVSACV